MKRKRKKKLNDIDKILIFCATSIIIFTLIMIVLFCIYQSVPDTLITAFFGVFTAEGCICWRIWNRKQDSNCENQAESEREL